jgi:dihydrofolate reductase
MRKLVLSVHTSLDCKVAGLNGEIDWVNLDPALFDRVAELTDQADTALYGRVTYQLMENYWPGAGDKPDASKHDIEHSRWYNSVNKIVVSNTLKGTDKSKTLIIGGNIVEDIRKLKSQSGKNILIFGSPSASHSLMRHNLIDEYWLFMNPLLLGQGIPLFRNVMDRVNLRLLGSTVFRTGVVELHYEKAN